jgi:hypothetical protein
MCEVMNSGIQLLRSDCSIRSTVSLLIQILYHVSCDWLLRYLVGNKKKLFEVLSFHVLADIKVWKYCLFKIQSK